jgi:hypothetical protein
MYGPKNGDSLKDKAEADARWVGEFSDELTVAIALRRWEEAVSLVEKGTKSTLNRLIHPSYNMPFITQGNLSFFPSPHLLLNSIP